jgi:hypothetical protein
MVERQRVHRTARNRSRREFAHRATRDSRGWRDSRASRFVHHAHALAALFSRRASALYRAGLGVGALCLAAGIAAPCVYIRTPYAAGVGDPIEQPVAFDHRHHVRDDGIDCVYCHATVERDASAGIPSTARCMGCHAQVWPDSPKLAAVRDSWRTGVPIAWRQVDTLPAYVYFHHGVHVQANVACAECHGDVGDEARVALGHTWSMAFCLDCHRRHDAGAHSRVITQLTTCSACHR